jgi:hypothetical protein
LARTNIIGELMDLNSGNLLPGGIDEIEVGDRLVERYHSLWEALTVEERFNPNEMWKIEERVNHLNELGFAVDELEVKSTEDGQQIRVKPMVVDAGYASRKLMRLTGLDVQENQARRLLNDLDAYKASTWRQNDSLEIVATDWMRDVFEPTVRMIPPEYRSTIEPAQFFHDVLTERWLLAEKVGHDVPMMDAVNEYITNKLPDQKIDTGRMDAINADADAGVYDDETVASAPDSGSGSNSGSSSDSDDDYDQDSSVWSTEG